MKNKWNTILIFSLLLGAFVIGMIFIGITNAVFRNLIAGHSNPFISNGPISATGPDWFRNANVVLKVQNSVFFLTAVHFGNLFNFHIYFINPDGSLSSLSDGRINILLLFSEVFLEIICPTMVVLFLANVLFDVRYIKRHRFVISEIHNKVISGILSGVNRDDFLEENEAELLHELRVKRSLNLEIKLKNRPLKDDDEGRDE